MTENKALRCRLTERCFAATRGIWWSQCIFPIVLDRVLNSSVIRVLLSLLRVNRYYKPQITKLALSGRASIRSEPDGDWSRDVWVFLDMFCSFLEHRSSTEDLKKWRVCMSVRRAGKYHETCQKEIFDEDRTKTRRRIGLVCKPCHCVGNLAAYIRQIVYLKFASNSTFLFPCATLDRFHKPNPFTFSNPPSSPFVLPDLPSKLNKILVTEQISHPRTSHEAPFKYPFHPTRSSSPFCHGEPYYGKKSSSCESDQHLFRGVV